MKIFIEGKVEVNNKIIINDEYNINHVINVMRRNIGDFIEIGSNNKSYKAEIISLNPMEVKILEEIDSTESNINIDIYQGLPKFDKMELIIEKATELGVSNIYPVEMQRSVVKLDKKSKLKKIERWNKIAESAAKQSKRDIVPEVKDVIKLKDIDFNKYDLNIFLDTKIEEKKTLYKLYEKIKNSNSKPTNIAIIIGPEGGLTEEERESLKFKTVPIKLGRRILRTETASIVIISILQYLFGDI